MPLDLARARADTPACADVIHFNNAGSSLMPKPVLDAQIDYLEREAQIGGYEAGAEYHEALSATYDSIAELLGARRSEIALLENATRAWQAVFYGMSFGAGDRILTDVASYASSYIAMLQIARKTGAEIIVIPDDADGQIDLDALGGEARNGAALIALTHMPTNGGLINPAEEVGGIAKQYGIPYLLDACQSAGQIPLDVDAIGCDALSATGRKYVRGPRGTGFLYVRHEFMERLEPPMPDLLAAEWTAPDRYELRPDARRFESWEGHMAGKLALGTAVRYAMSHGLQDIRERVDELATLLRNRLAEIDGVTVHCKGRVLSGIVTFSSVRMPALEILRELRARRMNVSRAVPSGTLLDSLQRDLPDLARASVHYFNTEDEVERFVDAVRDVTGA